MASRIYSVSLIWAFKSKACIFPTVTVFMYDDYIGWLLKTTLSGVLSLQLLRSTEFVNNHLQRKHSWIATE